jgi:DNA polymerase I-like protein with 3'-5' exonuclease and polymerase domains
MPDLATLPNFKDAKLIALDCETKDPNLFTTGPSVRTGGYTVGTGIAIDGGPKFYLPYRHENGENLPHENVKRYLNDQFKHYTGDVTGANLGYDLDYLIAEDVSFNPAIRFRDVQVAEPLLDEHKFSYSLDNLSKQYLGEQKDKNLMVEAAAAYGIAKKDVMSNLWRLPAEYVGAYGEQDLALPLKIIKLQELEIERQGLRQIYDLETDLLPVLVRMRRRGVKIDIQNLDEIETFCFGKVKEAASFLRHHTGVDIGPHDFMKPELIRRAFEKDGIQAPHNLDKEWLSSIAADSPVAAAVLKGRRYGKIENDFVQSMKNHMVNGRIHATYNALRRDKEKGDGGKGTITGRLSCENPNLQQQPGRDPELGPWWRKNFIPDDGGLWAALDYSQQEPKMLVHWAELCKFPGAKEAGDQYRNDPSTDHHQMMADIAGIERKDAKEIFLGLCYGMGQPKLCHKLGLPTEIVKLKDNRRMEVAGPEGKKLLRVFDTKVPYVSKMAKLATKRGASVGYVTTLLGRRCRFPLAQDGLNFDWTNNALNKLIQGSSADQTKKALLMIDQAGYAPQLQVHDEIDLTVENKKQAIDISEIMLNCVDMRVPSKVDVEIGTSWGDSMEKK